MRETHQVHCGGCRNDNTFHDFDFMTTELIFFASTGNFKSQQNILFCHSHPLFLMKLMKGCDKCCFIIHIHSPFNSCHDTHTHGIPSKLQWCNWSNTPLPTPLTYVELVGAGSSISNGGDGQVRRTLHSHLPLVRWVGTRRNTTVTEEIRWDLGFVVMY